MNNNNNNKTTDNNNFPHFGLTLKSNKAFTPKKKISPDIKIEAELSSDLFMRL